MPFAVDTLPETLEREPNNTAEGRPAAHAARHRQRADPGTGRRRTSSAFEGRAGEPVVAEVRARRLGSPLDSSLELTDADRHALAFNDDYEDKASGLLTHHADSLPDGHAARRTAPTCCAWATSQRQGGPEYGYRLRIGPPRPDFELRVTPPEINAGAGTTVPITVHALRRDGFSGDIALALKDAPAGFALSGAVVPGR